MVPVRTHLPSPEPFWRKPEKKEKISKSLPGERWGVVQGAGNKHSFLIRKQCEDKHPCLLCCPGVWIQGTGGATVAVVSGQSLWEQEPLWGVTRHPKMLTTACKHQCLFLTSARGWVYNTAREGHLKGLCLPDCSVLNKTLHLPQPFRPFCLKYDCPADNYSSKLLKWRMTQSVSPQTLVCKNIFLPIRQSAGTSHQSGVLKQEGINPRAHPHWRPVSTTGVQLHWPQKRAVLH